MQVRFRRLFQPSNLFLLAIGAGCISDTVSYRPADDDQAMTAITNAWTAPSGVQLSLCEDLSAPEPDPNDCQIEHVVRGGGRGLAHDEERGGGCGGCPFANAAYVRGTISGGSFAPDTPVTGTVTLGVGAGADPYDYPYNVSLECVAPAACSLGGTLEADGTLTIDYVEGLDTTTSSIVFARGGAAACP